MNSSTLSTVFKRDYYKLNCSYNINLARHNVISSFHILKSNFLFLLQRWIQQQQNFDWWFVQRIWTQFNNERSSTETEKCWGKGRTASIRTERIWSSSYGFSGPCKIMSRFWCKTLKGKGPRELCYHYEIRDFEVIFLGQFRLHYKKHDWEYVTNYIMKNTVNAWIITQNFAQNSVM